MKIYDISLNISPNMVVYPGESPPNLSPKKFKVGKHSIRTTMIELSSHTGTHIDSPFHMFPNGLSVNQINLSELIGEAIVIDIQNCQKMTIADFRRYLPLKDKIILIKTGVGANLERGIFIEEHLIPDQEVISFLIYEGIKAIGIDALSIDKVNTEELNNHSSLLEAGVPIIEGITLEQVPSGSYFCVCLPLKISQIDGAPARIVLIRF